MMNPKSKTVGWVGVIFYVLAVVNFYSGQLWLQLDHKDLFWAGTGLLLAAIWLHLSGQSKD